MTMIIKSISDAKGGTGGSLQDDFKDIIANQTFGGAANIKTIEVKGMTDIKSGDYLETIRFVYNVVTKNETSYEYQGKKRGVGKGGLDETPVVFAANEELLGIGGSMSNDPGGSFVIKYLTFKTSQKTLDFGKSTVGDQEFVLPPGVIFGNSGTTVDSIGVYEIEAVTSEPNITVPSATVTSSYAATETIFIDNPRTIIGLSVPLAALSILVLVLLTLYYKFNKGKGSLLRIAGSNN